MGKKALMAGPICALILAGCTVENRIIEHGKSVTADAESGIKTAASPAAAADVSPIKVSNGVYVAGKPVRVETGDPLPAKFEKPDGITLVRAAPSTLREIAAAITTLTHIPIVIAPRTKPGTAQGSQEASPADSVIGGSGAVNDMRAALNALATPIGGPSSAPSGNTSQDALPSDLSLNYSGKLSGLLDVIATHFNLSWTYESGRIVFDSVVTRSFDVPSLPIIAKLNFDLTSKSDTSSADSSGSSTTSGQVAETSSQVDVWKDMQETLKTMVGTGNFSANTTTGVLTVTADPATIRRVGEYIKVMNERLSQQIAISVKVYSVRLNDSEDFDLNVAGILQTNGQGFNIGNAISSAGVVPPVGGVGAGLGWALLDGSSRMAGSNALIQALSTRGEVSVVTTASVTTVNGVPVPLQVGLLRDYVKRVTTTLTDSGTQTQIEPGSVTTGFNLHLVPRVDRQGDLMLQYGINISELVGSDDGFETFTSNGVTVQLRRLNQRNFIQQARIPNGNTLVLAGFEQVRSSSERSGAGHFNFPFLGGNRHSLMEREILVIAITPTLLDMKKK